jgi:hypothetical protein
MLAHMSTGSRATAGAYTLSLLSAERGMIPLMLLTNRSSAKVEVLIDGADRTWPHVVYIHSTRVM